MPKKLKTYRTSLGFFELAIAAPSMKAALEAWGSKSNLFHQGSAKETDDPAIVAATSARPGVILKRAVGSNDIFTEHAALPRNLGERAAQQTPIKAMQAGKEQTPPKTDDRIYHRGSSCVEREEKRRERARQKKLAALEKQRKKRELAIANAEAAMEAAKRTHETKIQEIEDARSALDRQSQEEDARWEKQSAKLEAALSRARR